MTQSRSQGRRPFVSACTFLAYTVSACTVLALTVSEAFRSDAVTFARPQAVRLSLYRLSLYRLSFNRKRSVP
ncbi:hypothetical protein L1D44_18350 [Shewanella sp. Isolate13]|uniref:hypothetical protein n=1 Tax=Shewanella sp. Isolate13 TaxID=2908531 RepID=UPI001EFCCE90|nr:hypothetical protein [Shewanella sp. Isolate13]MCG9731755.1 hypothetical protein [Shewanella sp. Isolate13]